MILRKLTAMSMIAGTSIGAAVLAMPLSATELGWAPGLILLTLSWLAMALASLYMLEANLHYPVGVNMLAMMSDALGFYGERLGWLVYVLLLYCLNAAYLGELSALFHSVFPWQSTDCFAVFVCLTTMVIIARPDWVGGISLSLLLGLVMTYVVMVVALSFHAQWQPSLWDFSYTGHALPIFILAFGYQIIIPSLRRYLVDDQHALVQVILVGSGLPFLIYAVWLVLLLLVLGQGTVSVPASLQSIPLLLTQITGFSSLHVLCQLFIFFALASSFLGVSVSLFDVVKDGLALFVQPPEFIVALLAYVPPLLTLLYFPNLFLWALRPAGALVGILLMVFPVSMAMVLRQRHPTRPVLVRGGWWLAAFVLALALLMIVLDVASLPYVAP